MSTQKRKKTILEALRNLGGQATTREIAIATNLNVNGVSQTLGSMSEQVTCLGGRGGDTKWKLE
jgi:hypothetical protein